MDFSKFEVLLPDWRVGRIRERIAQMAGRDRLEGVELVTFIQPRKTVDRETDAGIVVPVSLEPMAVFAAISPNPRPYARQYGASVLTSATASLRDWSDRERESRHFVDVREDPALGIFRVVVKRHLETMDNLRSMN